MSGRRRPDRQDAIEMLSADHRRVQKLFREFAQADHADPAACRELVELACNELAIHTALEAAIFYPAARERIGPAGDALVREAEVEHETARSLVAGIGRLAPGDPQYAATFAVLGEYVNHHIAVEQQAIFPRVRATGLDLALLGAALRARREALVDGAEAPGQAEPSAGAAGEYEPALDELPVLDRDRDTPD